jgi:hypothetical protein
MTKFRGIKSVFLVAITTFSITAFVSQSDATAKARPRLQKQSAEPAQFRSACTWGSGMTTVVDRPSGRSVQVQTTCQFSADGRTTIVARPFGSENDKYVCVGECRVVRMCLLQYCYNETVCNPCARVVVVMGAR